MLILISIQVSLHRSSVYCCSCCCCCDALIVLIVTQNEKTIGTNCLSVSKEIKTNVREKEEVRTGYRFDRFVFRLTRARFALSGVGILVTDLKRGNQTGKITLTFGLGLLIVCLFCLSLIHTSMYPYSVCVQFCLCSVLCFLWYNLAGAAHLSFNCQTRGWQLIVFRLILCLLLPIGRVCVCVCLCVLNKYIYFYLFLCVYVCVCGSVCLVCCVLFCLFTVFLLSILTSHLFCTLSPFACQSFL